MSRAALAVVVLTACAPDLTCELLANPSNCFAQAAAALEACMPARATPATLSADGKTCTFSDGVYVVFNYSLATLGMFSGNGIHMTVYAPDGTECGHVYYEDNVGSSLSVIVGSQSATWEVSADADNLQLVCPSHTYSAGSVACTEPHFAFSKTELTVYSVATPSPLFTCQ